MFERIPPRLRFCLMDIVPINYLRDHVFMGFSQCGQFLLSFTYTYTTLVNFPESSKFTYVYFYIGYFLKIWVNIVAYKWFTTAKLNMIFLVLLVKFDWIENSKHRFFFLWRPFIGWLCWICFAANCTVTLYVFLLLCSNKPHSQKLHKNKNTYRWLFYL